MVRPPLPGRSRHPFDRPSCQCGSEPAELTPETHASAHEPTFDSAHAAELYLELGALVVWLWWWVGIGAAVRLVGWQRYPDQVVDMLSVSSGEEAALTRVYPSGEVHVHQPGRLVEVLALLAWDPR